MGEVDTKPVESVQTALSLFENKACQNRCIFSGNVEERKERELDVLLKELANCKVQSEINESANEQATLKLEVYHTTVHDLSTQSKNSEAEIDRYREECHQAQTKTAKLESENKAIARLLLGSSDNQNEFLGMVDELNILKEELLAVRAELTAAKKLKIVAERRAELMELAVLSEEGQGKKILMQISALNEVILSSTVSAIEADKERSASFVRMEADLHVAKVALAQSHDKLEGMKGHLDMMDNLENELLAKMIQVDYLQSELKQLKELYSTRSEHGSYFGLMDAEKKRMQEELQSKVDDLSCQVELPSSNMQTMKREISEMREREVDSEVNIAMLKSDLHRSRSRIAAAEAAEASAMGVQAGLCLAVQQLALKAEATKMESQGYGITILTREDDSLIQEAGEATEVEDSSHRFEQTSEIKMLKEELESANSKISDLRSNLEEATRRADLAETAKAAIEDRLRKWTGEQQQGRSATGAFAEQSVRKDTHNGKRSIRLQTLNKSGIHGATVHAESSSMFARTRLNCVPPRLNCVPPLAKVLNMKH